MEYKPKSMMMMMMMIVIVIVIVMMNSEKKKGEKEVYVCGGRCTRLSSWLASK